ncbi:uncharacterized protein [Porites lutea]|uniref:uncharacterized protein n=1 Tax=Porites lutea TaxID=51062 RepID=UPI003CC68215
MMEQDEEVEMENQDVTDEEFERRKRRGFQHRMRTILGEGDVDKITYYVTPRALAKCETNALLMAITTNLLLRSLARKKGNEEQKERVTKLANSVDEFTSCLLDPLETSTGDRHAFGESLDLLLDNAIDGEQKKFLAHPVMQHLMRKKWFGPFEKMKRSSWLEVGRWTWLFLNIWCLFDIVLFPFLFALFYIKHRICKVTRRSKASLRFSLVSLCVHFVFSAAALHFLK